MPQQVPEHGFYYHFKHDPNGAVDNCAYEVVGVGFHTEERPRPREAHFVAYRPLYASSPLFVASKALGVSCYYNRPLEMWMEEVEREGKKMPRFQRITNPAVVAELKKIRNEMYP